MEYIDHIYFINLERRKDRLAEILDEFNKIGLIDRHGQPPERFDAISVPTQGILGCGLSHLAVLMMAKERGYKNVLICEDDLHFLVDNTTFNKELQQIFENDVDFDVIMFAYNLKNGIQSSEYPFLTRAVESSTASCYLVNGHYLDKLIELYTRNMPLLNTTKEHWLYSNDACWMELMVRDSWYITNRRIGIQRPSFSDNSGEFMDHGC